MYEGAHRKNARRDREPPGKWLTRSDVAQLTGSVSVGAIAKHKEVASTDGGGEGPDSQAPAQTSCSLYCWGLRAERALEPRHRISHSSARSLVRTRRKNHYGSIALQRYLTGVKGDPSGISGQCGRMLYFSVVVMTTLGLGDIVPMTSRSRGLVAGEAIFGITFAIVGDAARGILARLQT